MTIICALHDPNEQCTWIGGDTLIKDGGFLCPEIVPKWVTHNGWACGWTGHLRTLNVMEHYKEQLFESGNIFEIVHTLRKLLKNDGYTDVDSNISPVDLDQMFLIANAESVWDVGSDFAFKQSNPETLSAVGSGCDYAFGVVHALEPYNKSPKDIMTTALEAAIRYEADCGNDIWINCLSTKNPSPS